MQNMITVHLIKPEHSFSRAQWRRDGWCIGPSRRSVSSPESAISGQCYYASSPSESSESALETVLERQRRFLVLHSDSKNDISRFCGNWNGAVSCKPGPRRSILTRTPIDWSASVAWPAQRSTPCHSPDMSAARGGSD